MEDNKDATTTTSNDEDTKITESMDTMKENFESMSIQDSLPSECWGCGCNNNNGLHIKSYWLNDEKIAICKFKPKQEHSAGLPNVTNGGIIATIIDCHGVCTALAEAYSRQGIILGSPLTNTKSIPRHNFATASLFIEYKKPTPLITTATLEAKVTKTEGRRSWVHVTVTDSSGNETATAEVVVAQLRSTRTTSSLSLV